MLDLLGSFGADCGLSALLQKHGLESEIPPSQNSGITTNMADDEKDDVDSEDYSSDSNKV